ncbi:MAG: phosphoglycerate kinase [Candidatus Dormibacteria bacterium]
MSGIRGIDDLDVRGRRVLLRVDFNVPMHNGEILDDRRIRAALPTITTLRERGGRVAVVTHLGRPRGRPDPSLGVAPLAARLGELLGTGVAVAGDVAGESARALVDGMHDGEVVMLENVRFESGEESNDPELARRLASLADVYVNDAFGAAHRAHASTEGVAHLLPAAAGRLMQRELEVLGGVLGEPRRPLVAILGGAKISTKIGVLTNLLARVDSLFVGGAMACTFFAAQGAGVGTSLVEEDQVEVARGVLERAGAGPARFALPSDVVVAPSLDDPSGVAVVPWDEIPADRMVVDVGPGTVEAIAAAVHDAATVVWNGPLGVYEVEAFAAGTRSVARALGASRALSVVGGGDLGAAIDEAGVCGSIDFVSTGGGATLEFLEGRTLVGVAALQRR